MRLTAVYMKVPEGYIAFVEELPGANTKGRLLKRRVRIWKKPSRWSWMQTVKCASSRWLASTLFGKALSCRRVKRTDLIRHLERLDASVTAKAATIRYT